MLYKTYNIWLHQRALIVLVCDWTIYFHASCNGFIVYGPVKMHTSVTEAQRIGTNIHSVAGNLIKIASNQRKWGQQHKCLSGNTLNSESKNKHRWLSLNSTPKSHGHLIIDLFDHKHGRYVLHRYQQQELIGRYAHAKFFNWHTRYDVHI